MYWWDDKSLMSPDAIRWLSESVLHLTWNNSSLLVFLTNDYIFVLLFCWVNKHKRGEKNISFFFTPLEQIDLKSTFS